MNGRFYRRKEVRTILSKAPIGAVNGTIIAKTAVQCRPKAEARSYQQGNSTKSGAMLPAYSPARSHREQVGRAADSAAAARAWTDFWSEGASRCLDDAVPQVWKLFQRHWQKFAAMLAPEAHVLDIGCGGSEVARILLAQQPRLLVTGVDLAVVSQPADPRIDILCSTAMENLPFARSAFGGAVSQFGVEYGRTEDAFGELARVLKPAARVSLLVHHSESCIARDNGTKGKLLKELLEEPVRNAFLTGNAPELQHQMSRLVKRYPLQRLLESAAVVLSSRVGLNAGARSLIWNAVVDALEPERVLVQSFNSACVSAQKIDRWLEPLKRGFTLEPPTILGKVDGQPIAWKIEGIRRDCF